MIHGIGSRAERRAQSATRSSGPGLPRQSSSSTGSRTSSRAASASASRSPRASLLEPELLVADEPVSMLDVSVRAGILAMLDELRDRGLAVLMITHDLSTAAHFADRICVMYLGRIVEEGPARRGHRAPAASLHEGAALGRAAPRSPRRVTRADPARRDAEPDRGPLRLPLPPTLPDRDRRVPGERTGAARRGRRGRPPSCVLPCRLVVAAPTGVAAGSCARSAVRGGRSRRRLLPHPAPRRSRRPRRGTRRRPSAARVVPRSRNRPPAS